MREFKDGGARGLAVAIGGLAAGLLLAVPPAEAGKMTGLMDSSPGDAVFADAKQAKADVFRLQVSWRAVASGEPADPTNPADPAYDFAAVDAAVQGAHDRGLAVLLTVTSAPGFAEGENRPGNVRPGTWKPDPQAFGQFGQAVAERYSGSFGGLARVRFLQAWNEGNLDVHLAPQYQGKESFAPGHYREMLNAFYAGVHAAQPGAKVLTTGTAPYGDPAGGARTRPLFFWRKVFCLKGRRKLRPTKCDSKPKLDILAHHPINTSGGPKRSALHPDDSSTPDFKHVREILRKAEKTGQVSPGGHRQLWATEIWWESKPPDRCGVTLKRHARWIRDAVRSLWMQGARTVIYLSVRDQNGPGGDCGRQVLQSGLEFADGDRKPAFKAFRRLSK